MGRNTPPEQGQVHDARRTAWLASRGFRIIRFRNQVLDEDLWGVVDEIKRALEQPPFPALPAEGEGAEQGK
jgi:very-short-patch-repair endonuclease